MQLQVTAGTPAPLGARARGDGVNFALFSAHATAVELCLFASGADVEHTRVQLKECTDGVWHGHVHGVGVGMLYGYRVHGPYAPGEGHRFNPHKLCIDPYARQLSGPVRIASASYGFSADDPFSVDAMNAEDSAPLTPRAVVTRAACDESPIELKGLPSGDAPGTGHVTMHADHGACRELPWRHTWANTVIYEAHVGGMTRLHAGIDERQRGGFAALANPHIIEHLHRLGVTAIELMPVHAFVDDAFLLARGLRNYWGYSTFGFFAPEHRYLAGASSNVFRAMIDAFHGAGIEVILDVVYNHTAEGNAYGPTLSFRGIDNASYYRLERHGDGRYRDFTGCGNTLNMGHPRVRELVLDSLRYWAGPMGVDGFRFDLATTLVREEDGFVAHGQLFKAIEADPLLSTVKLIAEPWDLGPDGYRLGGFPPGWAEWNDRYRDTMRRFWRGDHGMLAEFAQRIHGSSDLFDHPGRGPWSSVNFIASHDGFTAMDLVSYSERHNEANGEDNRDGHGANYSCNHGTEGASDDPVVLRRRERQVRNLLATVLLSDGTPMLLAGDEFARTQGGNNNAYCQDNETNWIDWSLAEKHSDLLSLTQRLVKLRKKHPVLCREHFPHGDERHCRSGFADITWWHPRGTPMEEGDWEQGQGCIAVLLCDADQSHAEGDELVLLVFNPTPCPVLFALPASDDFRKNFAGWWLALSTAEAFEADAQQAGVYSQESVMLAESCVCVFEAREREKGEIVDHDNGGRARDDTGVQSH